MIKRRKVYASDWVDGFNNLRKVIPAILFLYFACLSPAISFGTIASQLTNNNIGVVEFLLSAGASGMVGHMFGISHYHGKQSFLILSHVFAGVCCFLRAAHGLHCSHWPDSGIHLRVVSLLYTK
jgi:hypothetical protein